MECRAHNHKNKCVLSFQVISILSVKIPSHLGYSRMSHSIYFQAFLESSLGRCAVWTSLRVTYPPENACRVSLFSNERLVVFHQCHFSSQQMHAWHFPLESRRTCLLDENRAGCFAFPYSHVPNVLFGIYAPGLGHSCHLNFPSLIKYL